MLRIALSLALAAPAVEGPLDEERAPTAEKHVGEVGCQEDEEDFAARRRNLRLGFALGSLPFSIAAIAIPLGARERDDDGTEFRPNCTIGKLCGNTCISWDKECTIDSGGTGGSGGGSGSSVSYTYPRGALIAAAVFGVLAVGLIATAFIAPSQLKRRRIACNTAGCSLTVRF